MSGAEGLREGLLQPASETILPVTTPCGFHTNLDVMRNVSVAFLVTTHARTLTYTHTHPPTEVMTSYFYRVNP